MYKRQQEWASTVGLVGFFVAQQKEIPEEKHRTAFMACWFGDMRANFALANTCKALRPCAFFWCNACEGFRVTRKWKLDKHTQRDSQIFRVWYWMGNDLCFACQAYIRNRDNTRRPMVKWPETPGGEPPFDGCESEESELDLSWPTRYCFLNVFEWGWRHRWLSLIHI